MDEVQLTRLVIDIGASSDEAERRIQNLNGQLGRLRSSSSGRTRIRVDASDADKAGKKVGALANILNSMKRIAFYRAIRTAIKGLGDAFGDGEKRAYWFSKTVGDSVGYVAEAFDKLSSGGFKMENQLGAAFATLKAAVTPILLEIIRIVTLAASAITQLFAALSGKSAYIKAVDYSKAWADNTKAGAGAAKEWKNQLLGFDEINRLEEPSKGGGGSSSKEPTDWENMFEVADLDGWAKKLQDLVAKLKLSINDVFFDWDNLNAENIVEKLIAGLSGLLGGSVGLMIGGVPGAIIGTLLGVGLGLVINALMFDHDGVLSTSELARTLILALTGLAGGVIGFLLGGPAGALIGATIGVGVFAALLGIDFFSKGGKHDVIKSLVPALGAFAGAAIGFLVGGPGGAAVGATLGLGVSMWLSEFAFSDRSNWTAKDYAKAIIKAISPFVGALIGFAVGGPGGALIGASIGLGISFALGASEMAGEKLARKIFGPIVSWCQKAHAWIQDVLDGLSLANIDKGAQQIWDDGSIWLQGFADGGIVSSGQLFVAREAGPELVGTIGNQTAVANNDQIISGIRQGVFEAVSAAMSGQGGGETIVKVYLDSREIKTGQQRLARAMG